MKYVEFIKGALSKGIIEDLVSLVGKDCGAIAEFKGVVREDLINSNKVVMIEFEAHHEIAASVSNEILEQAIGKFNLKSVCILHSLGAINAGQTCFYVGLSAAHRKEAFSALPWVVDQFKEKVPVFGKEILEDGNYVWKANNK